jgi:hypothetical protein
MDTANLRDFISFLFKLCHLGLALVKSPLITQTGSQILTEAGHTTSTKKQPAKRIAHIDETATQNQQWCTHISAVSRVHFLTTTTVTPNYNMTAALQMWIPDQTIPNWNMAPVSWFKDL